MSGKINWIVREAEKAPELIQMCLECKRVDCPGECDRFYMARDEIINGLRKGYAERRASSRSTSEDSAIRAMLTGTRHGAIDAIRAEKSLLPLTVEEVERFLHCPRGGAAAIMKLYGTRVGKKKFIKRDTLITLLTEVEKVGRKPEEQ